MSSTKTDNKYYRELDKQYLGGHLGATKTKELFANGVTEDNLELIADVGGKNILKKLSGTKDLTSEQKASVIKNLATRVDNTADVSYLENLDISKIKFSDNGKISNLDDLITAAEKETKTKDEYAKKETKAVEDLDKEIAAGKKRAEIAAKKKTVEDLSPEKIVKDNLKNTKEDTKKDAKKPSLTHAQKDFTLQRISSILGLDKKSYEKLVTDVASGKKNADYEKAQDLLKVNNKRDAEAFFKKYGIENTEENRKKFGAARKQLQEVRSASKEYQDLIEEGYTKEDILKDHFSSTITNQVSQASDYAKQLAAGDIKEAKEKAENEKIAEERKAFADKYGDNDAEIEALVDPNHKDHNKMVKKYNDEAKAKGITKEALAKFNAAEKKYQEKNKEAKLKAYQQKNTENLTEKSSTKPDGTKAQKAKETQTATEESSSYEKYTQPMKPKNATGQASESSSSDSKSSSSSAKDINVSINLVLDDKVIQAITQKVTAGVNKN